MLLPQGTILPNFYFFSIFLQKLCCLKRLFIMQRGVGGTPPMPRCYFLLSSTPTIDTEPIKRCPSMLTDIFLFRKLRRRVKARRSDNARLRCCNAPKRNASCGTTAISFAEKSRQYRHSQCRDQYDQCCDCQRAHSMFSGSFCVFFILLPQAWFSPVPASIIVLMFRAYCF